MIAATDPPVNGDGDVGSDGDDDGERRGNDEGDFNGDQLHPCSMRWRTDLSR